MANSQRIAPIEQPRHQSQTGPRGSIDPLRLHTALYVARWRAPAASTSDLAGRNSGAGEASIEYEISWYAGTHDGNDGLRRVQHGI